MKEPGRTEGGKSHTDCGVHLLVDCSLTTLDLNTMLKHRPRTLHVDQYAMDAEFNQSATAAWNVLTLLHTRCSATTQFTW